MRQEKSALERMTKAPTQQAEDSGPLPVDPISGHFQDLEITTRSEPVSPPLPGIAGWIEDPAERRPDRIPLLRPRDVAAVPSHRAKDPT